MKVIYQGKEYTVEHEEDNHYGLEELGEWVWKEHCEVVVEKRKGGERLGVYLGLYTETEPIFISQDEISKERNLIGQSDAFQFIGEVRDEEALKAYLEMNGVIFKP